LALNLFPEASLAECVRTLKPGGRIALSWWDDPSKQRIPELAQIVGAHFSVFTLIGPSLRAAQIRN
jgi:hypothetical protein